VIRIVIQKLIPTGLQSLYGNLSPPFPLHRRGEIAVPPPPLHFVERGTEGVRFTLSLRPHMTGSQKVTMELNRRRTTASELFLSALVLIIDSNGAYKKASTQVGMLAASESIE